MRLDRKYDYLYLQWAKLVKQRDNFQCQICARRGGELHAHHLNAYNIFESERYILSNGQTLCSHCHEFFHLLFGAGNNTSLQYEEFKSVCESIKRAVDNKLLVEALLQEIKKLKPI